MSTTRDPREDPRDDPRLASIARLIADEAFGEGTYEREHPERRDAADVGDAMIVFGIDQSQASDALHRLRQA